MTEVMGSGAAGPSGVAGQAPRLCVKDLFMWMRNERMRGAMARSQTLRRMCMGTSNRLQMMLLAGHKSPKTLAALRQARRGAEPLLSNDEMFVLHELGRAQSALDGDFAEFGVYQGCSARLLCEVKGDRPLHLFDTFGGLPPPNDDEGRVFPEGCFSATLERVTASLSSYHNVHFHPGLFPGSAEGLEERRFALLHIDVDLEASTAAGLEFFYHRMLPGGVIITHDYSIIPGVADAFRRFLCDKPEIVIELPTTQAMLIKRAA